MRLQKESISEKKVGSHNDQYIVNTGGQYSFIDGHWPLTGCYLQRCIVGMYLHFHQHLLRNIHSRYKWADSPTEGCITLYLTN